MNLEEAILDLTSRTPSGGTCELGDISFNVWYCSDYWEWEFQGIYYFDPQDLSEAIEAYVRRTAEKPRPPTASMGKARLRPRVGHRKSHMVIANRGRHGDHTRPNPA